MNTYVLLALAGIFLIALALLSKRSNSQGPTEQPRRRRLITAREEAMFNRLRQSLPAEMRVLAQVSFGALLTAKTRGSRNTFDRKIADFVVCDEGLRVLAIIELDDASHAGKGRRDAARDDLLRIAGYRVLRYANIPDIDQVRKDLVTLPKEVNHA